MAQGTVAPGIDPSAIFAGIRDAKMRRDTNYEREGLYLQRIDLIKLGVNRKDDKFLAIEKTIVTVLDPNQEGKGGEGKGHRVGETICHMMLVKHDSFLGNMKAFLAAVLDMKPEDIQPTDAVGVCAVDQPLTGYIVEVQNRTIKTRSTQKDFTSINYKRLVPPKEALQLLDAETVERFFPNGRLQNLAAAMAAEEAKMSGQKAA